jgi:outer membrane protein OmpA-like peptidoglycan-associated protein
MIISSAKKNKLFLPVNRILTLTALVVTLFLSGCKPKYEEAVKQYNLGYYRQAAVIFEEFSKNTKDKKLKDKAIYMAAECYRLSDEYDKANRLYERVLKKDPKNAKALLMRANMLKKMEMYREALDAYDTYLQEVPGDTMAEYQKIGCEYALSWTPDSSQYVVSNFKIANTKANDWAPMVASKKDDVLFFVSDREGGKAKKLYPGTMERWSDIWYIEKLGKKGKEKWQKPIFAEKNSTNFNDGSMTFDAKFATMYFTQCGGEKGKNEKCAIYEAKKQGPDWIIGDALDFCKSDTAHNYGHPALSPDGKTLYFSSDRDGGFGGMDIWAVTYSKRSKSWGNPVNLGPDINTKKYETFPYFNQHDNKLYFSSDGWPGLGGWDIFNAEPTDDITKWKERENLKEPLNSGGNDFGIVFNNKPENKNSGYFTSNRGDRKQNYDIYEFTVTPIVITIRGVISDCNSKKPLPGATVTLTNDRDTTKLVLKADDQGVYTATLREKTNYEIEAKYPEKYYLEKPPVMRTTYGIRVNTELIQDFCLENPLDVVYTLPIFYDLDKSFIRPDAARVLDTFAQDVLMKYPKLVAELGSHTDCRNTFAYNEKLAERRAASARRYLIDVWKIDSTRIVAKGYGETQLLNNCKCEGAIKAGYTPYLENKTKKMAFDKDDKGNVVRSYYTRYKKEEIVFINDTAYVPCDEFQHAQNRRTTVRFGFEDQISRAIVNQDVDINNTNIGKEEKDSIAKAAEKAKGPQIDISNAVKVRVTKQGNKNFINVMVLDKEPLNVELDPLGKQNSITKEIAAQWYKSKLINKGMFLSSGDKIKVGKVKLPSNKFTVESLTIGDYVVKNVMFTITDKVTEPVLGKGVFKEFKPESYTTETEYILIPKKAPKKATVKKSPTTSKAGDKDKEEVMEDKPAKKKK